jgi:L-aminopeptidase/D-esterase-like protein
MKGLTDIPGILVGHASDYDGLTGCTAILCESGAVAGGEIRGFATGTQEWDLLSPSHVTPSVHAVLLAGGSAFGLEAASGVRRFLEHKGVGFETGAAKVPLVPAAILYDLGIGKASARPTREMGEAAAAAARADAVPEGAVGAGTGATVGKLLGMKQAMKSGIGSWTVNLEGPLKGVMVSALAAVNAVGDVIDPSTNKIVAGARVAPASMEFADSTKVVKAGGASGFSRGNTTLVVVATNAKLDKVGANRLAHVAHAGMLRTIRPVNTLSDGDLIFGLSLGSATAPLDALGEAAAEAVAEAILRAVRLAPTLGGIPGLKK